VYNQQPDQKGILDQFKWSLQALAVPASDQLSLFPDFVCKADELTLDFDHWYKVAESHIKFTPEQTQVLAELDERLSEMSRNGSLFSEELWTEKGLETSETLGKGSYAIANCSFRVWMDNRASSRRPFDLRT